MHRYTEQEAAKIVLAYYRVIDGNREEENYLQHCDAMLRVCLEAFKDYTPADNNVIITLFLVCNQLDINLIVLDEIGAEDTSRLTQEAFNKADANLRAIVSTLTCEDVALPYDPEWNFTQQFASHSGNVVYMPIKKDR